MPDNQLSETAIIERLATEVMGWEKCGAWPNEHWCKFSGWKDGARNSEYIYPSAWNPLKSWDAWRQVEEKVMEDDKLLAKFILQFFHGFPMGELTARVAFNCFEHYMKADLRTRCRALLVALDSQKTE